MLGVIGDWIELKSGESWESVWTGLIGAFIIVVCANAVNGKFVKLHPRKMLGYRKKLCQCCQWSHSGQRLQVQQWTESRHLSVGVGVPHHPHPTGSILS